MFLIMGQTENEEYEMEMNVSGGKIVIASENGRYQVWGSSMDRQIP